MAEKKTSVSTKTIMLLLASFAAGALLSYPISAYIYTQTLHAPISPVRQSDVYANSGYKFTDPLIGFSSQQIDSPNYASIRNIIDTYIAQQKKTGSLLAASVYFRDILNSEGFVINPNDTYYPASLYKVPLMMVYYKLAQQDPSILSKKIPYTGTTDLNAIEEIKSPVQLSAGTEYTVDQLINHMIRYSDNNAADLLQRNLTDINHVQDYQTVYKDLGIDPATINEQSDSITTTQYAIFMRVLFNATYLDRAYSEKALQLLSETDFTQGIESGVPNGILVSNKFGETNVANGTMLIGKELSDCGIVYYPKHPYILCVAIKGVGDHIKDLENDLSSLSRLIFQDTEKRYTYHE